MINDRLEDPYLKSKQEILEKVIKPICKDWLDEQTKIHINSTGKFIIGGPEGDTGRWEKVLKRLTLLNKHYPISVKDCNISDFIRKFEKPSNQLNTIYNVIKNSIIDQGLVFFGGFAIYSYSK